MSMPLDKQTLLIAALVGLLFLFSTSSKASTMTPETNNRLMAVSYLNNTSYPRGMRNNNPGNIRVSKSRWQGKIPVEKNKDGAFEQFNYYVFGVRAMIVLIKNYIRNNKLDTIRKIMHKYAPTSENKTDTYAKWVADKSGLGIDQKLAINDATLRPLIKAMAHYENGQPAVEDDMFTLAYVMS
jgi:hypothetical protein